jgi:hypothetical protein
VLNVATMLLSLFIVSVQVDDVPPQSPPHPPKTDPAAGTAVNDFGPVSSTE